MNAIELTVEHFAKALEDVGASVSQRHTGLPSAPIERVWSITEGQAQAFIDKVTAMLNDNPAMSSAIVSAADAPSSGASATTLAPSDPENQRVTGALERIAASLKDTIEGEWHSVSHVLSHAAAWIEDKRAEPVQDANPGAHVFDYAHLANYTVDPAASAPFAVQRVTATSWGIVDAKGHAVVFARQGEPLSPEPDPFTNEADARAVMACIHDAGGNPTGPVWVLEVPTVQSI